MQQGEVSHDVIMIIRYTHITSPIMVSRSVCTVTAMDCDELSVGAGLGSSSTPPPVPIRLLGTSCRGITRAGVTLGCDEAPLVTRLTIHTVQPSQDTLGVITVSLRARYVRARSRLTVKCAGCRVRPAPRAAARHCRQVKVAGRPQSRLGTAASAQPTAYLDI